MSKGKFRARTPTLNPESTCPVFDWARALGSVLHTTTANQHRPAPEGTANASLTHTPKTRRGTVGSMAVPTGARAWFFRREIRPGTPLGKYKLSRSPSNGRHAFFCVQFTPGQS